MFKYNSLENEGDSNKDNIDDNIIPALYPPRVMAIIEIDWW